MAETIQIKRYPNRRFYARHTSRYVSLAEIEEMIQQGNTVEIRDSQTGEDLTRAVLTQIIMEQHPEKMMLFPVDMLHFILRSNDIMSLFLQDYFRQSLTYLDYLQKHTGATGFVPPTNWFQAWLDAAAGLSQTFRPMTTERPGPPASPVEAKPTSATGQPAPTQTAAAAMIAATESTGATSPAAAGPTEQAAPGPIAAHPSPSLTPSSLADKPVTESFDADLVARLLRLEQRLQQLEAERPVPEE